MTEKTVFIPLIRFSFVLGLSFTAVFASANATTNSTSTSTSTETVQPVKTKRLSGSASATRRNSLYNRQDGSEQTYAEYSLSMNYKLNDSVQLAAFLDASEDLKAQESDVDRLQISSRFKVIPVGKTLISSTVNAGIPVSKAQKKASLQGSLSTSARISANPKEFGWEKFSLGVSVSLGKNFHQFSTAQNGQINTEYSSSQSLSMGYNLTEKLSLAAGFIHSNAWNYNGTLKEYIGHYQELSYQVTASLSASLGHNYGNPVTNPRDSAGQAYQLPIIDDDLSFVSAGLSIGF